MTIEKVNARSFLDSCAFTMANMRLLYQFTTLSYIQAGYFYGKLHEKLYILIHISNNFAEYFLLFTKKILAFPDIWNIIIATQYYSCYVKRKRGALEKKLADSQKCDTV